MRRLRDASRLAHTELLPDEQKESACAFLTRAIAFFACHGVTVARVMIDNGPAHGSHVIGDLLAEAGLRHIRTRAVPHQWQRPSASS